MSLRRVVFKLSFYYLDACSCKRCSKYKKCSAGTNGKAICVCPNIEECPAEQELVCGSDGKTYGNECLMTIASCEENKEITVVADRKCGKYLYI